MTPSDNEGKRFLISGRVQGVGFRYFAHRSAVRLGVVGWVRNLPDGQVEALAAGTPRALLEFRQKLEAGPGGSVVRGLETSEVEPDPNWTEFEIRF